MMTMLREGVKTVKPIKFSVFSQRDPELKEKWYLGQRSTPSVQAKNWYELSSNAHLGWFIYFHSDLRFIEGYDSVRFTDGRTMRILRADQVGLHRIKLEVSV